MEEQNIPPGGNLPDSSNAEQIQQQMALQAIRDNQNLGLAFISGLAAALIGSMIWASITYITNYQIGWLAIGLGFLVGYVIRRTGQGIDAIYGILGAVLSLIACLFGNLLTICITISKEEGVGIMDVFASLDLSFTLELFKVTFSPIDLLFYGLAIYYGYKNSFYTLKDMKQEQPTAPDQTS